MSLMTHATNSPATRRPVLRIGEFGWIWIALLLLAVATLGLAPSALKAGSVQTMLPFAAVLAIVAVGQTLIVQQRGLDMSVGAIVTIAGLLVAYLGSLTGNATIAVALTCLICAAIGAVNGVLVSRIGISPIVATLATGALLMGFARLMSGGSAMPVEPSLQSIAQGRLLGLPILSIVAVAVVIAVALVLKTTIVGRRYIAVGSNADTALAQGTVTSIYQIGSYAAAGLCYAIAGISLGGFIGYATPTAGTTYLLPSIAAVVVGGTPFTGGRGSVIATGGAALFMTLLNQLVQSLGAGPAVQLLAQAGAIIVAVSLRQVGTLASYLKKRNPA